MTARERLAEAVSGRVRGHRGKEEAQIHVAVAAADLAEVAGKVATPTVTSATLAEGAGKVEPHRKVIVHADDVFHLLDLVSA